MEVKLQKGMSTTLTAPGHAYHTIMDKVLSLGHIHGGAARVLTQTDSP